MRVTRLEVEGESDPSRARPVTTKVSIVAEVKAADDISVASAGTVQTRTRHRHTPRMKFFEGGFSL